MISSLSAKSQILVDTFKLEDFKNIEIDNSLNNKTFQYKMCYNGNNIFILNDTSIISLSLKNKNIINSIPLNFLEFSDHNCFLVPGMSNIGILENNAINVSDTSIEKILYFHQLDVNLELIDSRKFIIPKGSLILNEDIKDISHFALNNDSLFITFGNDNYWEIHGENFIPTDLDFPAKITNLDIINRIVYEIERVKDIESGFHYDIISSQGKVITNSKLDPYEKNTFPSYYIISNKIFFIGKKRYFFDCENLTWNSINYDGHILAMNVFNNGFYSYSPITKSFIIINIF